MNITPQFVIPDVQSALLCEDVRQEMNGVNSLIGVINVIPAPQIPFGIFKLCLWTRWVSGLGKFKQTSRILSPDEQKVLGEATIDFELKSLETHATNVHFFGGLQFTEYGMHTVEIHINGNLKLRFPVPVIQARPPQPQA
jgi:hypothetical protein